MRFLSAVLAGLASITIGVSAHAATTLTLHTPGPRDGAWGKVFRAWRNVVEKKSDGEVLLEPKFNETLGDEAAVMAKVENGEVGGGFFTARGLSTLDPSVLALQVRGAYASWAEFDSARGSIENDLIAQWEKRNVKLVGWADVGIGRFMSRGFDVKGPSSLAGKRIAVFKGDVISPKLFGRVDQASAKVFGVNAILGKLEGNEIDVVTAPSYAAEQLGWTSRLDHLNTAPLFFAAGAVVVSNEAVGKLSDEHRVLVIKTGERATKMLDKKLDAMGYSSYSRLKSKLKTHTPSEVEKKQWHDVYRKACQDLQGTIPKAALTKTRACD